MPDDGLREHYLRALHLLRDMFEQLAIEHVATAPEPVAFQVPRDVVVGWRTRAAALPLDEVAAVPADAAAPDAPTPRAAYLEPEIGFYFQDEDGAPSSGPFVRWALAFGCAVTIGRDEDDELSAVVAMSDGSGNGHERRRITEQQLDAYGRHLVDLAGVPAETTMVEAGLPKTVREALCVAQSGLLTLAQNPRLGYTHEQLDGYRAVLDALVRGVDVHRPLGVGGTHGDLHTNTCGCEDGDHRRPWSITIAAPAAFMPQVGDHLTTRTQLQAAKALDGVVITGSRSDVGQVLYVSKGGSWYAPGSSAPELLVCAAGWTVERVPAAS